MDEEGKDADNPSGQSRRGVAPLLNITHQRHQRGMQTDIL